MHNKTIGPLGNTLVQPFNMGICLSCLFGDTQDDESYGASPSSFSNAKNEKVTRRNDFINSPAAQNSKAKLKSDHIDALIEKQAVEQNNIVKILLLGKD